MDKINEEILGIYVSLPKPTGKDGKLSAIHKEEVATLQVGKETLPGDDPYDKRYHGGSKRVIHHYSLQNYQLLKEKFPEVADRFKPGTYGENIVTEKLSEEDLFVGDIFQLGEAKIQLTIPRSPCSTIDMGYEHQGILKEIIQSGHFGWFYQILETGEIKKGDTLKLVERPYPNINLMKLIKNAYKPGGEKDKDFLEAAAQCDVLDDEWKKKVNRVLEKIS